jgi:hypothetical protein
MGTIGISRDTTADTENIISGTRIHTRENAGIG